MTAIICLVVDADDAVFEAAASAAGAPISPIAGLPHFFTFPGSAEDFPLKDHPFILSVEDDGPPRQASLSQDIAINTTLSNGSWALPRTVRRAAPWNVDRIEHPIDTFYTAERDGTGVDIYMVDSGVYTAHAEFSGRATNVYEYYSSGGVGDDNGHGTLCASVAAGETTGFARGALIWSFKSSYHDASGALNTDLSLLTTFGQVISHYNSRSALNRPAVVSLSINPVHSSSVVSAIGDMINLGMVCVISAGNEKILLDGSNSASFPTPYTPDAIVVGGMSMNDRPYYAGSDGTNYGSAIHILSPGQGIYAAAAPVRGAGDYEVRRGTSVACPFVSGVVACMLQGHSRLTTRTQVQAVKAALLANATTGRRVEEWGISPLPDRILYLDPYQTAPEPITGL